MNNNGTKGKRVFEPNVMVKGVKIMRKSTFWTYICEKREIEDA